MVQLPWVESFLLPIAKEYGRPAPAHTFETPTQEDWVYIQSICQGDSFDTLGLKQECLTAVETKKGHVTKCVSALGSFLVLSMDEHPFQPPWKTWWRAVRILSPHKPVRIVVFAHPRRRMMPARGTSIEAEHLNGGLASRCDPSSIIVYRKEEATRVIIHELLHSTCSDPYHRHVPEIEADTEAWAEMILCAMAARGKLQPWVHYMHTQIQYSLRQAATVRSFHHVRSQGDYAWRYIVGRLEVWRKLGIQIPTIPNQFTPISSLRFTVLEPKNV